MKGLIAWIVGVALTASSVVAPTVIADENGEVHHWSSTGYLPSDHTVTVVPADRMISVAGMAMAPGTRIYFVNDDPTYDLSGAGDHWFLIGDGTAFHDNSWKETSTFVSTGGVRHEVIPIPAEYRQDWLAVMAGDRPVRTLVAPRSVMETNDMAVVPTSIMYVNNGVPMNDRYTYTENGTKYRTTYRTAAVKRAYVHRKAKAVRTSTFRHRYNAATASTHRKHRATPARYSYTTTRTTEYREPVAMVAAAPVVQVTEDQMGHELFQIHSSWYMKSDGDWYRGESWRGPFARVKKGTVPREVRMSAKHESRAEMD